MPNLIVDSQPDPLVSSEPTAINPSSHNFSKSILIGILIFILLSLTAYGAYWYTKNYLVVPYSQPTISNVPPETSQPENSFSNLDSQATPALTDETAGWKKYTNPTNEFTFLYPSGWDLIENTGESTVELCKKCEARKYNLQTFSVMGEGNRYPTIDSYIKNSPPWEDTKVERIKFREDDAVIYTNPGGTDAPASKDIFLIHNGKGYSLTLVFLDNSARSDISISNPNILSTFKFL